MASSDITVSGLSKIGNENAEYLVSKIRTIPGFPKEGILFVISCLFWQMRVPSDCYLTHSKPRCRSLPMNSISSQVWKPADSFLVLRWQRAWQGLHRSAQGWQASSGNR